VVQPLAPDAVFPRMYIDQTVTAEPAELERDVVQAAVEVIESKPSVGAIVLECTNFVPFSNAIRRATGRPVYDLYTAVMHARLATSPDAPWQEGFGPGSR
jgi:hypothetical protein